MEPNSFDAEAVFQRAMTAYQAGQLVEAEQLLRIILVEIPTHDGIMTTLGGVLLASGQIATSIELLQEAIQLNAANPDAYLNLGIAFQQSGNTPQAIAAIQQASQLAPQRPDIAYNLANVLLETQQFTEAIQVLHAIIEQQPDFLQAYDTLGAVYHYLQKTDIAQQTYEQALLIEPNDLKLLTTLGNLLADTGQTAAATTMFQRTIEAHPDHFLGYALMGKFYLDLGKNNEGLATLEKAYSLHPGDLNVNILLGNANNELGRTDQAEQFYRQALDISPDDPGALSNFRRLMSSKIPYWHFEMLADSERNNAYQAAIEKAVTPATRVLDIGTGSGLLSMMAARAGAERIVACEMNERLAATADEIIALNGYDQQIDLFSKKSTQLKVGKEVKEKVDLIISEILDVGAFGEGVLPSIRHAVQNLAKPEVKLIPAGLQLFGQLIEIPFRSRIAPVKEIAGFDLSPFEQFRISDEYFRIILKAENYQVLSPVIPLMKVDFYKLPPAYPDDRPMETFHEFSIEHNGSLQALVFWFDLQLDDDIIVSSRPEGELEHWGQALFCFPQHPEVKKGDKVRVKMLQSDMMIRFRLMV
ncbi:tetratricopeptide repeat protein [Lewinella sp. LCG006]|uniref:tetratricopeptide repeat protein n=1 Tax=Lewinella sp. LCG006 TaxID=3231911 RepID=UPI0034613384